MAAERLDIAPHRLAIDDGVVIADGEPTELEWNELVWTAYTKRVNLSAHAHYATPGLWYDKEIEQGEPFAYHVFGTAILEVTVDCLRGIYTVDRVRMVHDEAALELAAVGPLVEAAASSRVSAG